jgi:HJR/Mrr/RecB family endonuclease
MTGREFEEWTEDLFLRLGFSVELTPASHDGGVDLVARNCDVVGVETTLYVQCKNHVSSIGVEPMRALVGCLPNGEAGARAAMICPSGFTSEASRFGIQRGVQLIDAEALGTLVREADAIAAAARADSNAGEGRNVPTPDSASRTGLGLSPGDEL